jgi:hypothetical protein
MRITTSQLAVFVLLYVAYALSLVIKRNYAFWKDAAVAEGVASAAAMGSLGALYESASGAAKVGGAVLVDLLPPAAVLAASLAGQGAACLLADRAPHALECAGRLTAASDHPAAQAAVANMPAQTRLALRLALRRRLLLSLLIRISV